MMKKITTLTVSALGALALASGCSTEMLEAPEGTEVSETAEPLACANHQAVHSVMSALAVSMADELGRWKPHIPSRPGDFYYDGNLGIVLTAAGESRCNSWPNTWAPKRCKTLKANMELFKWEMQGTVIGGVPLDVGSLRSRMYAAWDRQRICMERPDHGLADNCPVEAHELRYWKTEAPATSCSNDIWYHAYKPGTTSKLNKPAQLANMLLWAGWDLVNGGEKNPWIGFVATEGDVKIDPLPGMTDGVPTEQSGGAYLVPFNYTATPNYGYVESFNGVNITNMPCKAHPDYCTTSNGYCPTTIKYLAKRAFSATKYDCKKDSPY